MSVLPVKLYSVAAIKAAERAYAEIHGSCYELMLRAGKVLADAVHKVLKSDHEVWIFCGSGNNGGDGYVAGKILSECGIRVRLFAIAAAHEGSEAQRAYREYISADLRVESSLPSLQQSRPRIIIDALLGTGITKEPGEKLSTWISFINRAQAYVISADCPSGVNADTGEVPGDCVNADKTVCMLALKPGLFTSDAVDYVGTVEFADLSCDMNDFHDETSAVDVFSLSRYAYDEIKADLPVRLRSCNKGDNGRVLIIAGAQGMGGAAVMAGCGALRAGAGLVKIATDPANVSALNASYPELMTVDFNDDEVVKKALQWCDLVAIGPGLSQSPRAHALLDLVVDSGIDCVADADALTLLSKSEFCPQENRILTPHPGEAARLLHCDCESINKNRLVAARRLQQMYGGTVVLKGAGTVVCDRHGECLISDGSPALACGGSGDLLTGIISALAAGGMSLRQAAIIGVCIHGKAGKMSADEHGPIGSLPTDLEMYVRRLVNGRV